MKQRGYRCGETIEALPSGVRVRLCRNHVKAFGEKCWRHRQGPMPSWPRRIVD